MIKRWFLAFAICLLAACNKEPEIFSTPAGDLAEIDGVTVSRPEESELDQLKFMTAIRRESPDACTVSGSEETCSIDASEKLKWGWGFCANDQKTLEKLLEDAQVQLLV